MFKVMFAKWFIGWLNRAKCPCCGSGSISRQGPLYICNSCGHEWD